VKGGDRKQAEVQTSNPFQISRLFNLPLRELIERLAITFAVRYEKTPKVTELAQYKEIFEDQGSSDVKSVHLGGLADDDAVLSVLLAGKYLKRLAALKRSDWMESELTMALQKSSWNEHSNHVQRDLSIPHSLWRPKLSIPRVAQV
jgi:hypothetical protein